MKHGPVNPYLWFSIDYVSLPNIVFTQFFTFTAQGFRRIKDKFNNTQKSVHSYLLLLTIKLELPQVFLNEYAENCGFRWNCFFNPVPFLSTSRLYTCNKCNKYGPSSSPITGSPTSLFTLWKVTSGTTVLSEYSFIKLFRLRFVIL